MHVYFPSSHLTQQQKSQPRPKRPLVLHRHPAPVRFRLPLFSHFFSVAPLGSYVANVARNIDSGGDVVYRYQSSAGLHRLEDLIFGNELKRSPLILLAVSACPPTTCQGKGEGKWGRWVTGAHPQSRKLACKIGSR